MLTEITKKINYYFWASYRRKLLDQFQKKYSDLYHGVVLDIGGRDRGNFEKPKNKVEKWIFADINTDHNPDILLDVSNMEEIATESTDVVNAIELFEHVEKIEDGIRECFRILKSNGIMIATMPFMYPIHADPYDYQRWTKQKWKKILSEMGFQIEKIETMGGFFTILSDMLKNLNKRSLFPFRYLGYIFYPLLDILIKLDNVKKIKKSALGKYVEGYFIIARR